jgi:hypothetical protein
MFFGSEFMLVWASENIKITLSKNYAILLYSKNYQLNFYETKFRS